MSSVVSTAVTTTVAVLIGWAAVVVHPQGARTERADGSRVVEIRVYSLKEGTREQFHQLFMRESLPMLRRQSVDVVAYGASSHDATSYYLVRSFASLEARARSEEAFYGSREWREGPREAVLAAIETYSTVVVHVDRQTLAALRRLIPAAPADGRKQGAVMQKTILPADRNASDVAALLALNDDYIRSVQTSDVRRFQEILADDFLCSLPDGSQIDRTAFLAHTAAPAQISDLQAHDVNVRVLGDFALVHARTTFTTGGRPGAGRYTDAWARRGGRWVAIAAHVTRY